AVKDLRPVLHRPEGLEVDVLAVGGEADLPGLVGIGDVLALLALPDSSQTGQRPPFRSCAQGSSSSSVQVAEVDVLVDRLRSPPNPEAPRCSRTFGVALGTGH